MDARCAVPVLVKDITQPNEGSFGYGFDFPGQSR